MPTSFPGETACGGAVALVAIEVSGDDDGFRRNVLRYLWGAGFRRVQGLVWLTSVRLSIFLFANCQVECVSTGDSKTTSWYEREGNNFARVIWRYDDFCQWLSIWNVPQVYSLSLTQYNRTGYECSKKCLVHECKEKICNKEATNILITKMYILFFYIIIDSTSINHGHLVEVYENITELFSLYYNITTNNYIAIPFLMNIYCYTLIHRKDLFLQINVLANRRHLCTYSLNYYFLMNQFKLLYYQLKKKEKKKKSKISLKTA